MVMYGGAIVTKRFLYIIYNRESENQYRTDM